MTSVYDMTALYEVGTMGAIYEVGTMSARTPENRVKAKVKKALDDMEVYHFTTTTGGFGNSGVPDIVACANGRFFGIECKAGGRTPTALQQKHLDDIRKNNGVALVVDEDNVDTFRELFFTLAFK